MSNNSEQSFVCGDREVDCPERWIGAVDFRNQNEICGSECVRETDKITTKSFGDIVCRDWVAEEKSEG